MDKKRFMDIDKEILNKTTKCEKDFNCLQNKTHVYCQVDSCLNYEVHFIKCKNEEYCIYRMSFGESFICNCPTRKEIFNKYGK